eukprot:GDKJ01059170.1.p1 GENE.GDKJ01059170.1~~GDKJ01059170.1.p1  ORF type:complete len:1721 (-),score=424.47 GDKJ01059170.1:509-5671(-)
MWCEKFSPACSEEELTRFEAQIFPIASASFCVAMSLSALFLTRKQTFKRYRIVQTDISRYTTLFLQALASFIPALAMDVWDEQMTWYFFGIIFSVIGMGFLNLFEYGKGVNLTWITGLSGLVSFILITLGSVNALGSLMSGNSYVSEVRLVLLINWLFSLFTVFSFGGMYPFRGEMSFYVDPLYEEYLQAKMNRVSLSDSSNKKVNEEDDTNISAELANPPETPPLPVENIGLISFFFYSWITPMMTLGTRVPLKAKHLYQLPKGTHPSISEEKFEKEWMKEMRNPSGKNGEPSLFAVIKRIYGRRFLISGFMKLTYDCLQYLSPILLNFILDNLGDGSDPYRRGKGVMLALLLFANQSVMTLLLHQYWNIMFSLGMELRSGVTTAVFNKSLKINTKTESSGKSGSNVTSGQYVALISVDAQRLQDFTAYVHVCWSGPFQTVGGIIFTLVLLGPSALCGLGVLMLSIPVLKTLMQRYQGARRQVMGVKSRRLKLISELMQGIKIVKLYAWESTFQNRIEKTRAEELAIMWRYRMAKVLSEAPLSVISMLVCVASFGCYIGSGNILDSATAFTSVLVFDLLKFPLFMIPNSIMQVIDARVACNRLQAFLQLPEVEPREFITPDGTPGEVVVEVKHRDFLWTKPADSPSSSNPPDDKSKTLEAGGADAEDKIVLKDVSFSCKRGTLTAVVGATGSGKTGLIQGILSEIYQRPTPAFASSSVLKVKGRVALATQTPWIQHGTLRNNILFNKPFDSGRYAEVIRVCALESDLKLLPAGDDTEIGEKGINLSGGQKARVALARAAYASEDMDVVILDDVLSAVDAHVSEQIFTQCIKGDLFKNCAVIMVSHNITLLPQCDQIVVLGGGAGNADNEKSPKKKKKLDSSPLNDCECSNTADLVDASSPAMKGNVVFVGSYHEAMKRNDIKCLIASVDEKDEKEEEQEEEPSAQNPTGDQLSKRASGIEKKTSNLRARSNTTLGSAAGKQSQSNLNPSLLNRQVSSASSPTQGNIDAIIEKKLSQLDHDDDEKEDRELMQVTAAATEQPSSAFPDSSATPLTHAVDIDDALELEEQRKAGRRLVKEETAAEGAVDRKVYKEYFWSAAGPVLIIGVLLAAAGNQGIGIYGKSHLSSLSDETVKKQQLIHLAWYAGCGIVSMICVLSQQFFASCAAQRGATRFHKALLARMVRAPMRFFDSTPVGRILNRFSKDTDTIDDTLSATGMTWLEMCAQVIATIVAISIVMPWFLIALVPLGYIFHLSQAFFIESSRQLKRIESLLRSPVISYFGETIQGLDIIRSFSCQQAFQTKNKEKLDWSMRGYFLSVGTNRWLGTRNEFVGTLATASASLLVVIMTGVQSSSVSASAAGLALSYSLSVSQQLNWMVRMSCEIETNIVAVERVLEYSECPQEARHDTSPDQQPAYDAIKDNRWPVQGQIEIKNVSLRYAPELPRVLKNLTVSIRAGERVGLVGRTGAGKSTLLLALLRLVELDDSSASLDKNKESGKVIIDGIDISTLGLDDLRSKVSVIPQDPVMFDGTVRFNLDPFDQYPDEDVISVVRKIHLEHKIASMSGTGASAEVSTESEDADLISSPGRSQISDAQLKEGLKGKVLEGGSNFSLGERQLLCMGRALLRKSKIVLLDEATSAIDYKMDAMLQETLREAFVGSTVITIAHRINTIIDYDKVLVLDKGRRIEFDAPENLLKKEDSIFRSLAIQAGVYEENSDQKNK